MTDIPTKDLPSRREIVLKLIGNILPAPAHVKNLKDVAIAMLNNKDYLSAEQHYLSMQNSQALTNVEQHNNEIETLKAYVVMKSYIQTYCKQTGKILSDEEIKQVISGLELSKEPNPGAIPQHPPGAPVPSPPPHFILPTSVIAKL